MSIDTRLDASVQDAKAGTAAWDDARNRLVELWSEKPSLTPRDELALEVLACEFDKLIDRADALLGGLVRLMDRTAGTT